MDYNKITAIVLGSRDYKESDKIVELYTLELGKISVLMKGVKKKDAKLRIGAQNFCFAEYSLTKTKEFYTVTGLSVIDSFFDITNDIDKFYCAGLLLEFCDKCIHSDDKNNMLFVSVLKALQRIAYTNQNSYLIVIKFLLSALSECGYCQKYGFCAKCMSKSSSKFYIDVAAGGIVCTQCRTPQSVETTFKEYKMLKKINSQDITELTEDQFEFKKLALDLASSVQELFGCNFAFIRNIAIL